LDLVTRGGFNRDVLRRESAPPAPDAERMMRCTLLMQACPDEDVIEHASLALEAP
jgi:hypothetical protein